MQLQAEVISFIKEKLDVDIVARDRELVLREWDLILEEKYFERKEKLFVSQEKHKIPVLELKELWLKKAEKVK